MADTRIDNTPIVTSKFGQPTVRHLVGYDVAANTANSLPSVLEQKDDLMSELQRNHLQLSREFRQCQTNTNQEILDACADRNRLETTLAERTERYKRRTSELDNDYQSEIEVNTIPTHSLKGDLQIATSELERATSELEPLKPGPKDLQKENKYHQASISFLRKSQKPSSQPLSSNFSPDSAQEQIRQLTLELQTTQAKIEDQFLELEAFKQVATLGERLSSKQEKPKSSYDVVKIIKLRQQLADNTKASERDLLEDKTIADAEITLLKMRIRQFERQTIPNSPNSKRPASPSHSLASKHPRMSSADTFIPDDHGIIYLPEPPHFEPHDNPSMSDGHFECLIPGDSTIYISENYLPTSLLRKIRHEYIPLYDAKGKAKGRFCWQKWAPSGHCAYNRLILRSPSVFIQDDRACSTCINNKRPCIVGRKKGGMEFAVLLPLPANHQSSLEYNDPGFWVKR